MTVSPELLVQVQTVGLEDIHGLIQLYRDMFDLLPYNISMSKVVSRDEFPTVFINRTLLQYAGIVEGDLLGKKPEEYLPADQAAAVLNYLQGCYDKGVPSEYEFQIILPIGKIWLKGNYIPLKDAQGQVKYILAISADVTAAKERELVEREHQEQIIQQQAVTLAELSTPLLAINATTVVMPLVGAMDSRRVQQLMEVLLSGISESGARSAILDITGVPIVDTQVASALIRASQAVSLLGAQMILTGIRPEVAQTLVGLGVALDTIITRGTLQDGIAYALNVSNRGGQVPH